MLLVKQELLGALAAELEKLFAGAGDKAVFESPKVAAHGDFACTAAMQLAKPLKQNPRQVAEALRSGLLLAPVFQRWVEGIDIAGPGFLNIKLKPQAKQQVVREVLAAGAAFGSSVLGAGSGSSLMAFISSGESEKSLRSGRRRERLLPIYDLSPACSTARRELPATSASQTRTLPCA